jgi:hypothetical protein
VIHVNPAASSGIDYVQQVDCQRGWGWINTGLVIYCTPVKSQSIFFSDQELNDAVGINICLTDLGVSERLAFIFLPFIYGCIRLLGKQGAAAFYRYDPELVISPPLKFCLALAGTLAVTHGVWDVW